MTKATIFNDTTRGIVIRLVHLTKPEFQLLEQMISFGSFFPNQVLIRNDTHTYPPTHFTYSSNRSMSKQRKIQASIKSSYQLPFV